jgi:catechol 2,3-dioxygenase-like lactoylglutathione lyase family enzyme
MKILSIPAVLVALAPFGFSQNAPPPPAPPTDTRVSNSHIHLISKSPDAQRHFWVDIMGATELKIGADRDGYQLPKVLVIVDHGTPTAGTDGSIVNHVGFRVHDMKDILAKVAAANFTIQVVNPSKDSPSPTQAFFLGPDDLRVELLAGPNLTTVAENHQVHFFTPDTDAMQKWYVANFGAGAQGFGKAKLGNLDGVTLIFSPVDTPVTGTKGRALDHIGFEIKGLEQFCKELEGKGLKLDAPYHKVQQGFAVAFLTDPWGTRIELTERSAPAPSSTAQVQK